MAGAAAGGVGTGDCHEKQHAGITSFYCCESRMWQTNNCPVHLAGRQASVDVKHDSLFTSQTDGSRFRKRWDVQGLTCVSLLVELVALDCATAATPGMPCVPSG